MEEQPKNTTARSPGGSRIPRPLRVFLAALGPLILASAVAYFAPSVWDDIRRASGEASLEARVLLQGEFDSPLNAAARGEWLWPMSMSEVPSGPDADPRRLGAADAQTTLVRLNLRSSYTDRATIQRIRLETQRGEPLRGLHVTGDFGGLADVRFLHADLDRGTVNWVDAQGNQIPPLTIYVDQQSEENVDLLATASEGDFKWSLVLTYTVAGGPPQQLTVNHPDGDPFHTSSTDAAAVYNVSTNQCTPSPLSGADLCR